MSYQVRKLSLIFARKKSENIRFCQRAWLSLSFVSPVASCSFVFWSSYPLTNLFLYGWIASTTVKFTCDIKGPFSMLSHISLQSLFTALRKILIKNIMETSEDLLEDLSRLLIATVIDKYGHLLTLVFKKKKSLWNKFRHKLVSFNLICLTLLIDKPQIICFLGPLKLSKVRNLHVCSFRSWCI